MAQANGFILWEGASLIDGAPIVVIATGLAKASDNAKTGAQIQTFILRSDLAPLEAVRTGADKSICGDCEHRPALVEAAKAAGQPAPARCYVKVFQAPRSVWECYAKGGYDRLSPFQAADLFAGRDLRLGTYGDPAAAPYAMWARVVSRTASHTGYTHQWHACDPRFASLCMASADSLADMAEAHASGWRTFRVAAPGSAPVARVEVACPAAKESGARTQCAACKACGGATAKAKASIVIWDHSTAGAAVARRLAAA